MASTGYKLVGGADIGDNFRTAPSSGYTPGAVSYKVGNTDIGTVYLRKATSYLTSSDVDAFAGGQYFDGGSVQLNSKFAHRLYRPVGASSGGTTQLLTSGSAYLYPANYGNSGLYNLLLLGAGGSGGVGVSGGSGGGGGGGGGAICITGVNIYGLIYSIGNVATVVGSAVAYAGGAGGTAGGAGGTCTGGGYAVAWPGATTGGAGGAGTTGTGAGGTGGSVAATNYYVDWTDVGLQYLGGGSGAAGVAGGTFWFPPAFGHDGFWYTKTGAGGGGGGSAGSAVYANYGNAYGGGGSGQNGGFLGGQYPAITGGGGALYIMWNS